MALVHPARLSALGGKTDDAVFARMRVADVGGSGGGGGGGGSFRRWLRR